MILLIGFMFLLVSVEIILLDIQRKMEVLLKFFDIEDKRIKNILKK